MNIVFLNSLAIPAASCQSTNLSKEPLQSTYDLLPDSSREEMRRYHKDNGQDTYYHEARIILMLKSQTLISGKPGVVVIVSDMLSGPGQKILLLQAFFLLMRTAVQAIGLAGQSIRLSAISSERSTSTSSAL